MSDVVWGPVIEVSCKRPAWLGDEDWNKVAADCKYSGWQYPGSNTIENVSDWGWEVIERVKMHADHPHYAQPSPADTVTVVRMSEDEASAFGRHRGYGDINSGAPADCHYYGAMRDLGLIRPATRAETIATRTSLPLADVERVIVAMGEEG